ncbi:MAG: haloalkane dehalogenase [Gemmatimonadaceae bacterium]|nr:haloalkane dehalogenase [Gemmatimonadaceae bacterium]
MKTAAAAPGRFLDLEVPPELAKYDLGRVRIHYVEAGEGRPILFLHGNPTSSYLWRNMLPAAARHGHAIAIDLMGHGWSDKPNIAYTFAEHAAVVRGVIEALALRDLVLVLHDWGGPLGFHYALETPDNVRAIAAMETFPWRLWWKDFPPPFRLAFRAFRVPALGFLLLQVLNLFVLRVLPATAAVPGAISPEALAQYRAFYPTVASRKAVRRWPAMLPLDPAEPTYAVLEGIERRLPTLDVPLLWLRATPGAITTPARLRWLEEQMPGIEIRDVGRAGHFIQEEVPDAITRALNVWLPTVTGRRKAES